MKKCFAILLTMVILASSMGVAYAKADSHIKYSFVQISHKGCFKKKKKTSKYSKIVRSYKQLEQLKKHVKKNFVKKKKYTKALGKYKKNFFKKKALVFAAEVFNAANAKTELADVEKKNNTIRLHVDRIYAADKPMIKMFISHTNTYLITVKKKDIKGAKKVKVKYTGVPYFSSTPETTVVPGTDATSTVVPTASAVASSTPGMSATPAESFVPTSPDVAPTPKCQLIVNGVNLTDAGHYTRYDAEKDWAEIPLIPVLEAIGAKIEWQNDNLAEVALNGEDYTFNVAEKSLTNVKTKFEVLFRSPGAYYPYYEVINGEVILDSNAIKWFLSENGYGIEINKETLTVIIEPLPADKMPMTDIKLIVNGVDLSEQGYYAVRYPVANYEDVPFIPVLEALGAKVLQEDEKLVTIEFYGEGYTFDKEHFSFCKEGDEFDYLYPLPGDFGHWQIIDGVSYVNLSSVQSLLIDHDWKRFEILNGGGDVQRKLDENMIIIDYQPEEGFPSN